MNEINRHNYEAFFIDYLDGNLSPSQEKLLWSFLKENPDLKQELDEFEPVAIPKENHLFGEKEGLKKTALLNNESSSNFDELCIAYLEEDLSLKGKVLFETSIKNDPEKSKILKIYQNTRLKADLKIVYPEKDILKKTGLTISLRKHYPILAVAASALLLIALYFLVPKSNGEFYQEKLAETEPVVKERETTIKETKEKTEVKVLNTQATSAKTKPKVPDEKLFAHSNPIEEAVTRETFDISAIDPVPFKPINKSSIDIQMAKFEKKISNKTVNYFQNEYNSEIEYKNITAFLAETISDKIIKSPEKNDKKFELFDVARWSVNGINRLTGLNLSLEKEYNKLGEAEKITFNSRLVAFSTPIKEK
ncbi:MAG: hypothetical protein ACLFVR_03690 [Thiohalospira sp.]